MKTAAIAVLLLGALAAQAAQAAETKVYGTKSGKKYHRGTCSYLRKSKIEMTLAEAKKRGLEPCSKCKPPIKEENGKGLR